MSILIEDASEDQASPSRLPSTTQVITKATDADTRYTCFLPPDWQGRLVVCTQPMSDAQRQDLLTRGYALGIARYPDKTQRGQEEYHLLHLQKFFARRCGTPQQVYAMGEVPRQHPSR